MEQEIILILAYTPTIKKQDKLRELINLLNSFNYRICLATHSSTPQDIIDRCDYYLYDKDNPIIYDPDIKYWSTWKINTLKFSFKDYKILSTHGLALWRMYSGALTYLKSLGEEIVHMIEYDTIVKNKDIFEANSSLLKSLDIGAVLYSLPRFYEKNKLICNWPFQSINISKIPFNLLEYNFNTLKNQYKKYFTSKKFPVIERMFFDNIWKNIDYTVIKLNKETDISSSLDLNQERIGGVLWFTINFYNNKFYYLARNNTKQKQNYTIIIDDKVINKTIPPGHWEWKPLNVESPNHIRILKENILIKELDLSKQEDIDLIHKYSKVIKSG